MEIAVFWPSPSVKHSPIPAWRENLSPKELIPSQLWFWRGVLNTTCWTPSARNPLEIADLNLIMGFGASMALLRRLHWRVPAKDSRSRYHHWFRDSANAEGEGTFVDYLPSGKNNFAAAGPEEVIRPRQNPSPLLGFLRSVTERMVSILPASSAPCGVQSLDESIQCH